VAQGTDIIHTRNAFEAPLQFGASPASRRLKSELGVPERAYPRGQLLANAAIAASRVGS
jgi:hypothetical protein